MQAMVHALTINFERLARRPAGLRKSKHAEGKLLDKARRVLPQISVVFAQQGRKRPEDYRAQGAPPREECHCGRGISCRCCLSLIVPTLQCVDPACLWLLQVTVP